MRPRDWGDLTGFSDDLSIQRNSCSNLLAPKVFEIGAPFVQLSKMDIKERPFSAQFESEKFVQNF